MKNKITRDLMLVGFMLLGFVVAPLIVAQQRSDSELNQEPVRGKKDSTYTDSKNKGKNLEIANFGAGCFWCVEAVFQRLDGVESVESGYMGGHVENPSYEAVCTGTTGHAEICQVKFDPAVVTFKELLEVFWKTHDPTTLNRQGADRGTQYRSAVFYTTDDQKKAAEFYKKQLDESGAFSNPIVTEVASASTFYPAGNYHADYYNRNPNAGYCRMVIDPKLDKFKKAFSDKLKSAATK